MTHRDINERAIALINGDGEETFRRITKATFKAFPSLVELVSPEYRQALQKVLEN